MNTISLTAYDNVAGNAYDKYHSKNPIARLLMQGFLDAFDVLVNEVAPQRVFEFGCGEGHLASRLLSRGLDVRGCDIDSDIVSEANCLSQKMGKGDRFVTRSIYELSANEIEADLIVCCEVLEHIPDPNAALEILASQRAQHWLFSVPREPIWRALNLGRGKYISALGNTPGHIQHWSSASFRKEVARHFRIVRIRHPLPWTMLLCTKRDSRTTV